MFNAPSRSVVSVRLGRIVDELRTWDTHIFEVFSGVASSTTQLYGIGRLSGTFHISSICAMFVSGAVGELRKGRTA